MESGEDPYGDETYNKKYKNDQFGFSTITATDGNFCVDYSKKFSMRKIYQISVATRLGMILNAGHIAY